MRRFRRSSGATRTGQGADQDYLDCKDYCQEPPRACTTTTTTATKVEPRQRDTTSPTGPTAGDFDLVNCAPAVDRRMRRRRTRACRARRPRTSRPDLVPSCSPRAPCALPFLCRSDPGLKRESSLLHGDDCACLMPTASINIQLDDFAPRKTNVPGYERNLECL